ncbi:P2X purinoceptor 7-like [Patella vulgata]|uniref:P2X purinoceptor 7-like n=1 Tax=Patella vulgata TaxID=6465 RepID=UPI0024A89BF9|nr:P2X purinoceptor 7-like [Patella vulgata]
MISNITGDKAKELLLAAEKMPGLVFDIAESATKSTTQATDPDNTDPGPSTCIESADWCTCSHCREMPTDEEKLCCNMAPEFCISLRPELEQFCLEPGVLVIANNIRNDIFVRDADDNLNKQYRHAAYRQFIYWRFGRLGEGNRRVIPGCVVWRIREHYPSPFGQCWF